MLCDSNIANYAAEPDDSRCLAFASHSDAVITLRQQKKMSLGDAIIAATALTHALPLVTRNVQDFRHIAGLKLINPFAPA